MANMSGNDSGAGGIAEREGASAEREGASAKRAGATAELAAPPQHRRLPAELDDFREQLPGLEPDRQLTDWGRSERIEALVDRTVYEFLYHYWLRVEIDGIQNVPEEGGALLVANRSGAVPIDAAMIAKALSEGHPRRRSLHLLTNPALTGAPGVGMVARKLGAVSDHPANVHRLLFDEGQLVLVFPEGEQGARKPIKERYRLRTFFASKFVGSAHRAGVPIIPIAVLGAEEASPLFAALRLRLRLPFLPLMPPFPLPSKFRLRFLEPIETDADTAGAVQARRLAEDIRALIQENLLELVAARRSVWLG